MDLVIKTVKKKSVCGLDRKESSNERLKQYHCVPLISSVAV